MAGSLRQWLKKAIDSPPPSPALPDPRKVTNVEEKENIVAANEEIMKTPESGRKRKRGYYNNYDSEQRAKMARYAVENGVMNAARRFSVNESTIRNLKKKFIQMKKNDDVDPDTLEKCDRGKPVLLGKIDKDVQNYIKNLRSMGGIVNIPIIIGAATGIVKNKNRQMLKEYGGSVELTKSWAQSLLRRMGYVKRKGTKAARKVPADFEMLKMEYHAEIQKIVVEKQIPDELIINFDQTNVYIVPAGYYTLEKAGSKQVPLIGLEDKRQVTVLLGCTLAGNMLPPQVIYQGKTSACHPNFEFPSDWHITHSENHWSNSITMADYIDHVIVPYVENVRDQLPLSVASMSALCIFDVYKPHCVKEFQEKLYDANICVRYVPASCTGELQPLDVSGNDDFKRSVKRNFQEWYSSQVETEMKNGKSMENINIDLRLSALKPLHAGWLVSAFQDTSRAAVERGWIKTGIRDAVDKGRENA